MKLYFEFFIAFYDIIPTLIISYLDTKKLSFLINLCYDNRNELVRNSVTKNDQNKYKMVSRLDADDPVSNLMKEYNHKKSLRDLAI